MENSGNGVLKKILWMVLDLVFLFGGFFLAYRLRFHHGIPGQNLDPFLSMAPWVGVSTLLVFYFFDLYSTTARKSLIQMFQAILMAEALLAVLIMALSFWGRGFAFPRTVIFLGVLFETVLVMAARAVAWSTHWMATGKRRVLIVARDAAEGMWYRQKMQRHAPGWLRWPGNPRRRI